MQSTGNLNVVVFSARTADAAVVRDWHDFPDGGPAQSQTHRGSILLTTYGVFERLCGLGGGAGAAAGAEGAVVSAAAQLHAGAGMVVADEAHVINNEKKKVRLRHQPPTTADETRRQRPPLMKHAHTNHRR